MTVAGWIGIGAWGRGEAARSLLLWRSPDNGLWVEPRGEVAPGPAITSRATTESFRSSWQAQVALLRGAESNFRDGAAGIEDGAGSLFAGSAMEVEPAGRALAAAAAPTGIPAGGFAGAKALPGAPPFLAPGRSIEVRTRSAAQRSVATAVAESAGNGRQAITSGVKANRPTSIQNLGQTGERTQVPPVKEATPPDLFRAAPVILATAGNEAPPPNLLHAAPATVLTQFNEATPPDLFRAVPVTLQPSSKDAAPPDLLRAAPVFLPSGAAPPGGPVFQVASRNIETSPRDAQATAEAQMPAATPIGNAGLAMPSQRSPLMEIPHTEGSGRAAEAPASEKAQPAGSEAAAGVETTTPAPRVAPFASGSRSVEVVGRVAIPVTGREDDANAVAEEPGSDSVGSPTMTMSGVRAKGVAATAPGPVTTPAQPAGRRQPAIVAAAPKQGRMQTPVPGRARASLPGPMPEGLAKRGRTAFIQKRLRDSEPIPTVGTQRVMASPGAAASTARRTAMTAAQSPGFSADTAGMVRDPGSVPAAAFTTGVRAGTALGTLPETFAALDAGSARGAPAWTHAGPRQAEAGFQDPALGWVGVRAETSGGVVHAAVIPGSAEAAQELSRHMDALGSYLAGEHTPVGSLAMASPGGRDGSSSSGAGLQQEMSQNLGQGQGRSGQPRPDAGPEPSPALGVAEIERAIAGESPVPAAGVGVAFEISGSGGMHISVMA